MAATSITSGQYLPLVSVIVPVYNVAKLLERCVDSIRNQIYPNLEIILVDDGSTDLSGSFCDMFARQDHRIKVIHQPNAGLSAARNAGLKAATGKWITFVDADDAIRSDMIDLLHKMCYQNRTKLAICGFREIDTVTGHILTASNSNDERVLTTLECLRAMLCDDGFSVNANGKLYARELFDLIRYPDDRLYEDVGTTYQLVLECDRISVSSAPAYDYYLRPESITHQSFTLRKLDLIDLTDQMCDDLLAWGKEQALTPAERTLLLNLTKKRRMHARFSILRQIIMLDILDYHSTSVASPTATPPAPDPASLKHTQRNIVKYLHQHKRDILRNPLATRRDRLAMRSLQLGLPVFKFAWQKYSQNKTAQ